MLVGGAIQGEGTGHRTRLLLHQLVADPAAAVAGVVLVSLYSHLAELPLGAFGWLGWALGRRRRQLQPREQQPTKVG